MRPPKCVKFNLVKTLNLVIITIHSCHFFIFVCYALSHKFSVLIKSTNVFIERKEKKVERDMCEKEKHFSRLIELMCVVTDVRALANNE